MTTIAGARAGSPVQAQLAFVNVGRWVYSGTRKLRRVWSSARRHPSRSRALVTVHPGPRTGGPAAVSVRRCFLVNKPTPTPLVSTRLPRHPPSCSAHTIPVVLHWRHSSPGRPRQVRQVSNGSHNLPFRR